MDEIDKNQTEIDWEAVVREEREQRIRELESSIARGKLVYKVLMLNLVCLSISFLWQLWQLAVRYGLFH